jgi:hypothetical protein
VTLVRRPAAAGMLALAVTAAMAACGAGPLAPLPVQTAPTPTVVDRPSGGPAATTTTPSRAARTTTPPPPPARTTAATTPPPSPSSPSPAGSPACFGAVEHDIDLRTTVLDLVTSLCFRAGGVLRLRGIGPGLVTATPDGLTAAGYEAGVVSLRFLRPGTVTVTVPQDDGPHTIEVVVIT